MMPKIKIIISGPQGSEKMKVARAIGAALCAEGCRIDGEAYLYATGDATPFLDDEYEYEITTTCVDVDAPHA